MITTKKEKTSVWTQDAAPEKPVKPEKLTAFFYCCVCVCVCGHTQASNSKGWEGWSLVLLRRHNIGTHLSEIRGVSVVFKGKELIQITGLVRGNVQVLMSIAVSGA